MNPGPQYEGHPPFHYATTLFVVPRQVLNVLYIVSDVLIRTKKERRNATVGIRIRGHQDSNLAPCQCADASFMKVVSNKFYILLFKHGPALKNTCVIHPFLFNPKLNFEISISPS